MRAAINVEENQMSTQWWCISSDVSLLFGISLCETQRNRKQNSCDILLSFQLLTVFQSIEIWTKYYFIRCHPIWYKQIETNRKKNTHDAKSYHFSSLKFDLNIVVHSFLSLALLVFRSDLHHLLKWLARLRFKRNNGLCVCCLDAAVAVASVAGTT